MPEEQILQKVKSSLETFVAAINANPSESLSHMEETYGLPCEELQSTGAARFGRIAR